MCVHYRGGSSQLSSCGGLTVVIQGMEDCLTMLEMDDLLIISWIFEPSAHQKDGGLRSVGSFPLLGFKFLRA